MRATRAGRTSISVPLAALTLLALLLTGCAGSNGAGGDDRPGSPPGAPRESPAATPGTGPTGTGPAGTGPAGNGPPGTGPSRAGAPAQPRVVLERSGGYAGRQDTITVEPDGRWSTLDRAGARRSGEFTGAELARWRELSTDPRLAGEAGRAPAPSRCDDAFSYRLTVGRLVIAYADCPADPDLPAAAATLVELLTGATG